jgi:hypothetical protein
MKLFKSAIVVATSFLCASFTQISLAQGMIYKNQRGSIMELVLHPQEGNTGAITGSFTTAVGNCKSDIGVAMPLTGFFNGNTISISVNFPHCKQVVAMTGHLLEENNTLYTLWLDAAQSVDPMKKDWTANISGADYYKRENK